MREGFSHVDAATEAEKQTGLSIIPYGPAIYHRWAFFMLSADGGAGLALLQDLHSRSFAGRPGCIESNDKKNDVSVTILRPKEFVEACKY